MMNTYGGRWEIGVSAAGYSQLHIRVRTSAVFGDEAVDPALAA